MEAIGYRIKQLRQSMGLTQEQFARVIGLNRTTICNYEADRYALKDKERNRILQALRLPEDYFMVDNHHIATEYNIRGK